MQGKQVEPMERAAEAAPEESERPTKKPQVLGVIRLHPELSEFYQGLDELRNKTRKTPVRVLWLGDSHTAADFMTQEVRAHLVSIAPDGGPGFVRLGMDGNRHGTVRFTEQGKWRKAPILPAQRTRVLDGVFGYGGIRTLPAATAGSSAELREKSEAAVDWTLSYRLPPGAKLEVRAGRDVFHLSPADSGMQPEGGEVSDLSQTHAGGIESRTFQLPGTEAFAVHHHAGDPQVFGAFGEFREPGVVLDTVGINGARVATVLAWEPEQFIGQIKARRPDLLVLAFGTNEVFDQTNPDRYVEHTEEVIALVRQGRPNIPCWIVGPPDSAAKDGRSKPRVFAVTEAQRKAALRMGCAFTSAYELMGGEGSFSNWARERPARARGDRIHLTIAGYRSLGEMLGRALVGAPDTDLPPDETIPPPAEGLEMPEPQADP